MEFKLQVGDVFRWRNYGVGNNFCTSRILGCKVKRLWRHRYWVLETQIEPSGYPHFGTPYYHPILTGKVSDDDFRYITSYGMLVEVFRPTKEGLVQVYPVDYDKITINAKGKDTAHPTMFTLDDLDLWASAEELNKERTFQDFIQENR